jgi:hypothetical protein
VPGEAANGLLLFHIMSKGLFEASQLTGEKKPAFGSGDEALAVPVVAVGFFQLLFGNCAAVGRCRQHAALRISEAAVCSWWQEFESGQN